MVVTRECMYKYITYLNSFASLLAFVFDGRFFEPRQAIYYTLRTASSVVAKSSPHGVVALNTRLIKLHTVVGIRLCPPLNPESVRGHST